MNNLEYNVSDDDFDEWPDSGPFCIHWAEAWDCDEKCTNCGVVCAMHDTLDHDFSDAKITP